MDILRKILVISLFCLTFQGFSADTIDINTADKETLMAVNGVGEKRAEAIIANREKNGPFNSIEQLLQIDGIGPSTLENNQGLLAIGQR